MNIQDYRKHYAELERLKANKKKTGQQAVRQLELERIIHLATTMTDEQYLQVLRNFHHAIKAGRELWYFDDTQIGNKDTQCSWGLCCRNDKPHLQFFDLKIISPLFPPETHMDNGFIKQLDKGQNCPFDKRGLDNKKNYGCFYECRIFQGKGNQPVTREEAVQLYEIAIDRIIHDPRNLREGNGGQQQGKPSETPHNSDPSD